MATTLPRTGAVIVGVGAAGGVAALPLAAAGIDVVGLEAGSWLSTRDMVPDELRLQRGALAAGSAESGRRSPEQPGQRRGERDARHEPSDDERCRRHGACTTWRRRGGSTRGTSRSSAKPPGAMAGREFRQDPPSRIGRSVTRISSRTTIAWSTSLACRATPETSRARRSKPETSSKGRGSATIRCRRFEAPDSWTGCPRRRDPSACIRLPDRPRSPAGRTMAGRRACTTASASAPAATSTRRARRR